MKELFLTYEQSLALKELGFDEPCFGVYINNKLTIEDDWLYATNQETFLESDNFTAPLKQQAFKFFREKYELNYVIVKAESWFYTVNGCNTQEGFNTYEEAENACIDKLINIAKNKEV